MHRQTGHFVPTSNLNVPSVHSAWAETTHSHSATQKSYGTENHHIANGMPRDAQQHTRVMSYATPSRNHRAAATKATLTGTNAPAAALGTTALRHALSERHKTPLTPLIASAWSLALAETGLDCKYTDIPHLIQHGFDAGIPPVQVTFTPPNNVQTPEHIAAFETIATHELNKGRWIGPCSRDTIESVIGPFQSSPISMVAKAGKPGKFRLVQNLSFPRSPQNGISSINSSIDSSLYPCYWGTFSNTCQLLWSVPPGSQGAVRDVAEAYRTIPLRPDNWPGAVVRMPGNDNFGVNICNMFGVRSGGGVYGYPADAGMDIMRAKGIGPISKWVDDHLFIRMLVDTIPAYNQWRAETRNRIHAAGGIKHEGGRLFARGNVLEGNFCEEFDDDHTFPIVDLSSSSPRSVSEARYSCTISDINTVSLPLGYIWESSKDRDFSFTPEFNGFTWHFQTISVSVPPQKQLKYSLSIDEWLSRPDHNLEEAYKLHGRLTHVSLVVSAGRAYLIEIESFISSLSKSSFKRQRPPRRLLPDIQWWSQQLRKPFLSRIAPGPCNVHNCHAYSDASSTIGIGIWISGHWRAYRLLPNWKRDDRDIGWAEAVGFWLLTLFIVPNTEPNHHYRVYGDNEGVVQGWWSGRSRNRATNSVFKHVHEISARAGCTFHTTYVASASNPADGPSRAVYPSTQLLLPRIPIPFELQSDIVDFDAPITSCELKLRNTNTSE